MTALLEPPRARHSTLARRAAPLVVHHPLPRSVLMGGHAPVLPREVIEWLGAEDGPKRFLDATFGGGGHARKLLAAHPDNALVGLDRDPDAEARAEAIWSEYGARFTFCAGNFEQLNSLAPGSFDGILFDLGVSSFHFDNPARGFSFRFAGPLDMRMDTREGQTARDFLAHASREELVQAVRNLGEEPRWHAVVTALLRAREEGLPKHTLELAELIAQVAGGRPRHGRGSHLHPATRTFQGLRMAVNDELGALERALPQAFEKLVPGGRLAIISFHSLEDRIVKRFFRRMAGRPEHARDLTVQDERTVRAKILTSKPIVPSDEEAEANARARSARLRVLEKLGGPPA